jgi:hypothetical protein
MTELFFPLPSFGGAGVGRGAGVGKEKFGRKSLEEKFAYG